MRKTLTAAAMLAVLSVPALAADLSVAPLYKAPPSNPFSNASGSGVYIGIGTTAGVSNSQVSGNNIFATSLAGGDLNSDGASVDAAIGYISGNTSILGFGNWWRVEASGSYQNITATAGGASVQQRWSGMQEFDVGADLINQITAVVGNLGINWPTFTPQLPANVAVAAVPKQYFGAIVKEFGMSGNFGGVGGETVAVAPGIKSGFLWQTIGINGKPNGGAIDAFAYVAWPVKGFTVNNVIGTGGAPTLGAAAVGLGTQYGAGLKYDF
jgi:hypothetical protein